jgi:hypothetical protein
MTTPRRLLSACALGLLTLAGAACSGGSSSQSTKQVTRGELAAMVLPKSELGAEAAALKVNPLSGFQANATAASGNFDPRVTAASLTRAGRLSGYTRAYRASRSQGENAIRRGAGLVQIGANVALYRDSAGAAGQLTKSLDDLRTLAGKPIKLGATLVRSATFRVGRIADSAAGARFDVRINGFPVYYTMVSLRHGRLLASVYEARADSKNVDAAVISFSQTLDNRIKDVLSGRIRAAPG